jgi:hypothetical protein
MLLEWVWMGPDYLPLLDADFARYQRLLMLLAWGPPFVNHYPTASYIGYI